MKTIKYLVIFISSLVILVGCSGGDDVQTMGQILPLAHPLKRIRQIQTTRLPLPDKHELVEYKQLQQFKQLSSRQH